VASQTIPSTVFAAFNISPDSEIQVISGGKINSTWLVKSDEQKYILQSINVVYANDMVEESTRVLDTLIEMGWDVPLIVRTSVGTASYAEGAVTWRLSLFIDSDEALPEITMGLMEQCGTLLAQLHVSLSKLTLTINPTLPHYREHAYHISQLSSRIESLPKSTVDMATAVVSTFDSLDLTHEDSPKQLIHADPKMNNILFRDKKPYTYIDWDTIMVHSPYIDIGDFLRSLTKEMKGSALHDLVVAFCKGYYDSTNLTYGSFDEFYNHAITSAQTIALENTARYLSDIVDQSHWKWDENKYDSHEDAMVDQATKTWNVYTELAALHSR